MEAKHQYQVNINWLHERKGLATSDMLPTAIEVATPPEFTKGIPGIWSPEHLLVAATSSCLMTTFLAIAENSKLDFISFECNAIGLLDKVEGKLIVAEIILQPTVIVANPEAIERTARILDKSEMVCLISNSLKSKIILQSKVELKQ